MGACFFVQYVFAVIDTHYRSVAFVFHDFQCGGSFTLHKFIHKVHPQAGGGDTEASKLKTDRNKVLNI